MKTPSAYELMVFLYIIGRFLCANFTHQRKAGRRANFKKKDGLN